MNKKKGFVIIFLVLFVLLVLKLGWKVYHNEFSTLLDANTLNTLELQMDSDSFLEKLAGNGFTWISSDTLYLSYKSSSTHEDSPNSIVFMVETECDPSPELEYRQHRLFNPNPSQGASSYNNTAIITYKQYKITIEEFSDNRKSTAMAETLQQLMID